MHSHCESQGLNPWKQAGLEVGQMGTSLQGLPGKFQGPKLTAASIVINFPPISLSSSPGHSLSAVLHSSQKLLYWGPAMPGQEHKHSANLYMGHHLGEAAGCEGARLLFLSFRNSQGFFLGYSCLVGPSVQKLSQRIKNYIQAMKIRSFHKLA